MQLDSYNLALYAIYGIQLHNGIMLYPIPYNILASQHQLGRRVVYWSLSTTWLPTNILYLYDVFQQQRLSSWLAYHMPTMKL